MREWSIIGIGGTLVLMTVLIRFVRFARNRVVQRLLRDQPSVVVKRRHTDRTFSIVLCSVMMVLTVLCMPVGSFPTWLPAVANLIILGIVLLYWLRQPKTVEVQMPT